MKSSKLFTLVEALAYAALLTVSLAVCGQAQTVTYLAAFNGTNGQGPYESLIQATDGNFYGAAEVANSLGGEVFRVTPAGVISTVYSFCSLPSCADGQSPSTPILGSDGNLYGTTHAGGSWNSGTIFKLTLGGKLTTLHMFHCIGSSCPEGGDPMGIIQASDGNFYGTTQGGGTAGVFFKISAAGEFKVLYTFCSQTNCTDGGSPIAPPIQARDGNFYGTGFEGGTSGGGVLYQLTPAGTYKVLYNFCYDGSKCFNNAYPTRLVQDASGNFFGTTAWAGSYDSGSVFELTAANRFIVLHRFVLSGKEDAATGVTLANDGNLYGMAEDNNWDNSNGGGNIFEVNPAGVYTQFYRFNQVMNGALAATYLQNGPLLQGTDGNFYGTTPYGQDSNSGSGYGTVFRFSNGLSPLVKTVPVAGKVGKSVIILGNGLTGTTSVTFNGVPAAFTVKSDTFIKATVPAGATTGTVSIVTPSETLNSNPQFVVTK